MWGVNSRPKGLWCFGEEGVTNETIAFHQPLYPIPQKKKYYVMIKSILTRKYLADFDGLPFSMRRGKFLEINRG
jgi:hypothetical protein